MSCARPIDRAALPAPRATTSHAARVARPQASPSATGLEWPRLAGFRRGTDARAARAARPGRAPALDPVFDLLVRAPDRVPDRATVLLGMTASLVAIASLAPFATLIAALLRPAGNGQDRGVARNPAAQTAFGPMVLTAIEQQEPPDRRLVDDDLAALFLPARMRWLVAALRQPQLRRLFIAGMDRSGPGLWVNLTCRKRFVADKLDEALGDIDAVVVIGAGLDTLAYRLTRRARIPTFEVDQPVNIARKVGTVRRVLGTLPLSVRLVALDLERDDLLTALAEHGYQTDWRAFFVWEGVTQYLTESGVRRTLEGLRAAAPGSRLVFTYVRRDFIDGTNLYGTPRLYRTVRQRRQLWHFGLQTEQVADFLAEYGWRLLEQAGPEELISRYVQPAGRNLTASDLEWSAYAEKE